MQLQDIMVKHVATIGGEDTITHAAERMYGQNVGTLVVLDEGSITGIITDRDIVVRCTRHGHDTGGCLVTHHMSSPVSKASPKMDIVDAARMMSERQIKRLPVVENGRLVGLVSSSDIACAADELIHGLHEVLLGMNKLQLVHQRAG